MTIVAFSLKSRAKTAMKTQSIHLLINACKLAGLLFIDKLICEIIYKRFIGTTLYQEV
jgi:hypothetical protein